MKHIAILLIGGLAIFGCGPQNVPRGDRPVAENLVIKENEEEEEYELIIIDNRFQSWFATNAKPVQYYSKSYYENQNQRYVTSWNELYHQTGGTGPFGNYINYNFSEDYGLELNYELFWYFKYIESRYGRRYNFPI